MRFIALLSLLMLMSCAAPRATDPNTLFPYQMVPEAADKAELKRVMIASVNYGQDSLSYLKEREAKVDAQVARYLREHGFEVITGNQFDSQWARATDQHGEYFDPFSATFRQDRFNAILADTLTVLREQHNIDALVFTDLIVRQVNFSPINPHYASWDGIRRRPHIRGANEGIPLGYSWAQLFRAASLVITIFRTDGQGLFNSVGGLEMIDDLNLKSGTPKSSFNSDLLQKEKLIREGVALAFHPFIPMPDYPRPESR